MLGAAGQMEFAHRGEVELGQEISRRPALVVRVAFEVVEVEQQAAAAVSCQPVQERCFA